MKADAAAHRSGSDQLAPGELHSVAEPAVYAHAPQSATTSEMETP